MIQDQLDDIFLKYEAMQARHQEALNQNGRLDVQALLAERDRAFEGLKQHLDRLVTSINQKRDDHRSLVLAVACQSRLAALLDTDDQLKATMLDYRNRMQQELEQMRHGRKALRGYGSSPSAVPRFVSRSG